MYNASTILLCVTIFVVHKQCLIRTHCSIVTVATLFYNNCAQYPQSGCSDWLLVESRLRTTGNNFSRLELLTRNDSPRIPIQAQWADFLHFCRIDRRPNKKYLCAFLWHIIVFLCRAVAHLLPFYAMQWHICKSRIAKSWSISIWGHTVTLSAIRQ
jgi:hypothetical protein